MFLSDFIQPAQDLKKVEPSAAEPVSATLAELYKRDGASSWGLVSLPKRVVKTYQGQERTVWQFTLMGVKGDLYQVESRTKPPLADSLLLVYTGSFENREGQLIETYALIDDTAE